MRIYVCTACGHRQDSIISRDKYDCPMCGGIMEPVGAVRLPGDAPIEDEGLTK